MGGRRAPRGVGVVADLGTGGAACGERGADSGACAGDAVVRPGDGPGCVCGAREALFRRAGLEEEVPGIEGPRRAAGGGEGARDLSGVAVTGVRAGVGPQDFGWSGEALVFGASAGVFGRAFEDFRATMCDGDVFTL